MPSGNGINPAGQNVNPDANPAAPTGTPDPLSLIGQGSFGTKTLGNMETVQKMQLANAPRDPQAYKSAIMQSGLISPEAYDAWASANMDQNGKIPAQAADYLEKSLGLKAQGNRAEFYKTQVGRNQLELLPSLQPPGNIIGAASQVLQASRMGKVLIANATDPQGINLASVEMSRAIQRAAPQAETIGAAGYGNSLTSIWNQLQQRITSDPTSSDVPLLRQQLYNRFDDLAKAALPYVQRHLQNMEDNGTNSSWGNNWTSTKNRELGMDIPDIPFNPGSSASAGQNPNVPNGLPTQPNKNDPGGIGL